MRPGDSGDSLVHLWLNAADYTAKESNDHCLSYASGESHQAQITRNGETGANYDTNVLSPLCKFMSERCPGSLNQMQTWVELGFPSKGSLKLQRRGKEKSGAAQHAGLSERKNVAFQARLGSFQDEGVAVNGETEAESIQFIKDQQACKTKHFVLVFRRCRGIHWTRI